MICDMLGIPLILKPPREEYFHGWGQECLDPKLIACLWEITVYDNDNKPTLLSFDLIQGSSPLVVGLDVAQHADTINLGDNPHVSIKRPDDEYTTTYSTYIAPDSETNPDCIRMRLKIFPDRRKYISTMLSNLAKLAKDDPNTFAKRIHRYTHVHPDQLTYLCDKAGIMQNPLRDAIKKIDNACGVCVQNGRPLPSKKISLNHVNEAFNEEVQVDFTFFTANESRSPQIPNGSKYTIIVFVDTGTKYLEGDIVPRRAADEIITTYERIWICRHGASKYVSADDEYNKRRFRDYMSCHNIQIKPRPTRRHNKTGIVERANGRLKDILRRLVMEKSNDDMRTILARALMLANMFSGSQILSSFELARGYQPSILGLPQTTITKELLEAHTQQMATRALQRVLRSRTPNIPTPGMFKPGDITWIWYASSKNNEPDQWIRAKVIEPHQHYIEVRRFKNEEPCRGPPMKPGYEDIRIAPQGELARSLMEDHLETALGYGNSTDRGEEVNQEVAPQNTVSSMLTKITPAKNAKKGATDDIGIHAESISKKQNDIVHTLQSERKRILDTIYENVGSHQVSRSKLAFAPPWILHDAFEKEYESNWKDAYIPIPEREVPKHANVITSHTVYKVKTDEAGVRQLKNRIVPHGNHDDEKDSIRKDSATAQLNIIRLLLSIVTFLGMRIATADIKGAYLQSGPIQRDIYVRPPHEWQYHDSFVRGVLWKLVKLPYGIVEAGRQWMKTVEDWMLNQYGLERVSGISQLFIKRDSDGNILLIIAKVTDDFLIGGSVRQIKHFTQRLQQRFTVGKVVIDAKFHFNGCEIEQDAEGNIKMSMMRYLDKIRLLEISRTRKKMMNDKATEKELKEYRALAGTLLYLGNGVMPQASYVVSVMQQQTGRLQVRHLVDANNMLKELMELKPWLIFRKPSNIRKVSYVTFSDASHPKERDYGQTGIVSGLMIESSGQGWPIFHLTDWTSFKQHRVSYSSYGAEILAAASADDRGYYFKSAMQSLFPHLKTPHQLIVDSRCLFDTITTLHDSTEYRLRPTVQRIRNSFEAGELDVLRWIPGTLNVADALTKRSKNLYKLLNEICIQGELIIDIETGYDVESMSWQ